MKMTNHRNIFMRAPSIALNFHKSLGMIPTGLIPWSSQKPTIMRTSATLIEELIILLPRMILCFVFSACCCIHFVCGGENSGSKTYHSALVISVHSKTLSTDACPEPARLTSWDQYPCHFFWFSVVCCVRKLIDPVYQMIYVLNTVL